MLISMIIYGWVDTRLTVDPVDSSVYHGPGFTCWSRRYSTWMRDSEGIIIERVGWVGVVGWRSEDEMERGDRDK